LLETFEVAKSYGHWRRRMRRRKFKIF